MNHFPLYLAPMEDVTDPAFRLLCKRFGADRVYTEFVNADALVRDVASTTHKLQISDDERPVAIQIYGREPEAMADAARIVEQAHPDIIDINFGCPVKKVAGKGAGAGLLRDVPKMLAITRAVVNAVDTPVTVKTRLGWSDEEKIIVDLAEALQDCGISEIAIHGRTRSQMYRGEADWTLIGEVKNNPRMTIPIIGNGDVVDGPTAKHFKDTYGVDGLMIGRASYGNPWIFKQIRHYFETGEELPLPNVAERVRISRLQLEKSVEWKGEHIALLEIRKHWSSYFKGLPNFKPFRMRLMEINSVDEIYALLDEIEKTYSGCELA